LGQGVETNPIRKSSRSRKTVEKYVTVYDVPVSRAPVQTKKNQPKKADQKGKTGIIASFKNGIKKMSVSTLTGTSKKYIAQAIQSLTSTVVGNYNITVTMIKNFLEENKEKIFGIKKIGLIRKMLERDDPITQGNSLYGSGSKNGLKIQENTFSWVSSDTNDGLVYCWATKVPCAFGFGNESYSAYGLNHEMEHVVPCVRQFMINGLSQQKNLKGGSDDPNFRKYHALLEEIFKKHGIGNDATRKLYIYYIFKMFRRQQVILGLPSIGLFNQVKCAINLVGINFKNSDNFLSFRLEPDPKIIKKMANSMDSNKKTQFTAPCNMMGVKHKESIFNKKNAKKLEEYYRETYGQTLTPKALQIAKSFANADKEKLLKEQCKKVCDQYNALFQGHESLSSICHACSVLIVTGIMKSTYVDLEIEHEKGVVPEISKWAEKALTFLQANISKIDIGAINHIDTKLKELHAMSVNNKTTQDYLYMEDNTIKDLIDDPAVNLKHTEFISQVGGSRLKRRRTVIDGPPVKRKADNGEFKRSSQIGRPIKKTKVSEISEASPESASDIDYDDVYENYQTLGWDSTQLDKKMDCFLDLMDCRLNESDFLALLSLFEGCEDLAPEETNQLIAADNFIEDKFICQLMCNSDGNSIYIPERMKEEFTKFNYISTSDAIAQSKKTKKKKKKKKKPKRTRNHKKGSSKKRKKTRK